MIEQDETKILYQTRYENIGRWLSLAFRFYEECMVRRMNELGFEDIRLVHVTLIRCVESEGSRFTEIAESAGMHKQAIGQLVKECEETGYVERKPDPKDGRAQLVCFTRRGRKLLRALADVHEGTELDFTKIIGAENIGDFKNNLAKIANYKKIMEADENWGRLTLPPSGARRQRGRPPKKDL